MRKKLRHATTKTNKTQRKIVREENRNKIVTRPTKINKQHAIVSHSLLANTSYVNKLNRSKDIT